MATLLDSRDQEQEAQEQKQEEEQTAEEEAEDEDDNDDSDPIRSLIQAYHALNPAVVDELTAEPTPLQMMHYVAKNRPFVVRKGAGHWRAVHAWNSAYLRQVMIGRHVRVAITPTGNADGVVEDERGGHLILVEPYEKSETFDDFLDHVQADAGFSEQERKNRNVRYCQTQNDNLRDEYAALFHDVPNDINFASTALNLEPDAVNFWLGNERSVTALHRDNYENIYVQIRGQKHFTLLSPVEMPCVNETPIRFARYQPVSDEDAVQVELKPRLDPAGEPIPTPIWDPDEPKARATAYSRFAKPLHVTLEEGDMMYLPAMWYHKVAQSTGGEDFSCAVNYWYDMDFSGTFWVQNGFLRDMVQAAAKQVQYPELRLGDAS